MSGRYEDDDLGLGYVDDIYKKVQKKIRLQKVAKELYENAEFSEARNLFWKLLALVQESDTQLEIWFQIAECDVMLERNISRQTDQRIVDLLNSTGISCHDIGEMARRFNHSAQVIINLYTCRLSRAQLDGSKAIREIDGIMQRATNEIKEMLQMPNLKKFAPKLVPLMKEMMDILRATDCKDGQLKDLIVASSLSKLGHVYNEVNKTREALDVLLEGLDIMKRRFGSAASDYRIVSSLENNIGYAYAQNEEYDEAEPYQKSAVADVMKAKDIPEDKKRELLPDLQRSLDNLMAMKAAAGFKPKTRKESPRPATPPYRAASDADYSAAADATSMQSTLQRSEMRDFGKELFESGEYSAARDTFQDLAEEQDSNWRLDILLHIAACDLMLHSEIQPDTDRKISSILEKCDYTWRRLSEMSESESGFIAILLQLFTVKVLISKETPDKVLGEIEELINRAYQDLDKLAELHAQDDSILKKVIWIMHELRKEIRGFGGKAQHHNEAKACMEVLILEKLSSLYNRPSLFLNSVQSLEEAREIFKKTFGPNSRQRYTYSRLSGNIGCAYQRQGNLSEASKHYQKAIGELRYAEDITDAEKHKALYNYEKALEETLPKPSKDDYGLPLSVETPPITEVDAKSSKHRATQNPRSTPDQNISDEKQNNRQKSFLVGVGNNIYIDDSKRLGQNRDVFEGTLGSEKVAVKKIPFSEESRQSVKRMTSLKKHPNTVEYKAFSDSENASERCIYIAMELCCQDSLYERLQQNPYSTKERIQMLLEFISGLCYLHSNNITHGNLTPRTLLFSHDGRIKIADYELSRTPYEPGSEPGQENRGEEKSKSSDISSAGMVFYHVLTGGKDQISESGEDIREEDLTCDDSNLARELISRMVNADASKRLTAEKCRQFPLFWDAERKLLFICGFSDRLEITESGGSFEHDVDWESDATLEENWATKLILTDAEEASIKSAMNAERTNVEVDKNAVYDDFNSYTVNGGYKLSILLRFIKTRYRSFGDHDDNRLISIFESKDGMWQFFNTRYPRLLIAIFDAAEKPPLWSNESKCEFLCLVPKHVDVTDQCEYYRDTILDESWIRSLILTEDEKASLQQKMISRGNKYRIDRHAIYNTAVIKERQCESDYDRNSLFSLLRFIANRRQFCHTDSEECQLLFADGATGIWNFFSNRFSNLFDRVHHFINSSISYSEIVSALVIQSQSKATIDGHVGE